MSSSSEALVAEVQQQQQQKQESTFEADLSSESTTEPPPTTVIPAIQFHRTLYLDGDGRPTHNNAPNNGGLRIHDVLSVPEDAAPCNLSSILPLLSYHRLEEAFVCLNAQGVLRATTPTLEVLSRKRSLSQGRRSLAAAACLLVAHRGQLYGVQVDEGGVAKVVGTVRQVVSSWSQGGEHKDLEDDEGDEGQTESCLVLDGKVGKVVRLGSVTFDPAHHVLVTVPLGGHCFAQLSKGTTAAADDKNEGEGEEGEYSTPLALLIGPAHILFTSTITLKWNAYVDSSMKEMVTKAVPPGSTFFQSSGGWWTAQTDPSVVEKEVDSMETPTTTTTTTYLMTGLGMRKCHFQEAFFYAQMHIGQTIKQKVIEKEEEENKEEDK